MNGWKNALANESFKSNNKKNLPTMNCKIIIMIDLVEKLPKSKQNDKIISKVC